MENLTRIVSILNHIVGQHSVTHMAGCAIANVKIRPLTATQDPPVCYAALRCA